MSSNEISLKAGDDLSDETELWRFMALGHFLAMLTSRELFQTRVDAFEDRSEGAFGYRDSDLNGVATALRMPPVVFYDNSGQHSRAPAKEEIIRTARASTAVTCWWRYRGCESFAMWRIYARDTFGVALVTTVGALRQLFQNAANVHIAGVSYEPLPPVVRDVHTLFFHKRAEYSDEREIRTVNVNAEPFNDAYPSVAISPDVMNLLLGQIVAAPRMPKTMFRSLLNIVQSQFALQGLEFGDLRLRASALDRDIV